MANTSEKKIKAYSMGYATEKLAIDHAIDALYQAITNSGTGDTFYVSTTRRIQVVNLEPALVSKSVFGNFIRHAMESNREFFIHKYVYDDENRTALSIFFESSTMKLSVQYVNSIQFLTSKYKEFVTNYRDNVGKDLSNLYDSADEYSSNRDSSFCVDGRLNKTTYVDTNTMIKSFKMEPMKLFGPKKKENLHMFETEVLDGQKLDLNDKQKEFLAFLLTLSNFQLVSEGFLL